MRKLYVAVILVGMLVLPLASLASGTAIPEQGSKASAQAGAFVARADDPTGLAYNPAGMAFFKGLNFSFNITYVKPELKYTSPTVGNWKSTATNFFIPSLFLTWGINDTVSVGFGASAPYALGTDWNAYFPGKFASRHAKITTMNYHPVVAFKFNENHAISIGLDYYDSKVLLTRNQDTTALSTLYNGVVLGNWYVPGLVPAYSSSEAYLTTDMHDHALGWDIGYMFKKDAWSFGLTYRSGASFDYTGNTYFYTDASRLGSWTSYFPAQKTRLRLDSVPSVAQAGFAYSSKPWTVEFDISRTQWSSWDRADAMFSNPTALPVLLGGKSVVPASETFIFDWRNTWCYRLGFGYQLNDTIELRWGALFDQAPIPGRTESPVLPDGDRWSVQFGMGYSHEHWGVDWYLMYIKAQDIHIEADNLYRYNATGLPTPPGPPMYRTTYPMTPDGKYTETAILAGFQLNYKF